MQVTLEFQLNHENFIDIIDTACYGAIEYWAEEVEYAAGTLSISCEEGAEIHEIEMADMEKAIAKIMEGRVSISDSIRGDVTSAIREDDYGYIDSNAADAIVQIACFGEIVYG
jgi:predicted MarR family transcription regulator